VIDSSYVLAGGFTGFVVGLTGVGGGALMTPILLLFFGVAPTTAIATDLWFAAITKMFLLLVHNTSKNVDWQVVKRLWWGSIPVSLAIVVLISFGQQVVKVELLTTAIGAAVLVTAVGLLFAPKLLANARNRRVTKPDQFIKMQPSLTITAGAALGLCVALTSVGAGALGSVFLLYLYPLRLTPHRLVATDIVHAIPLACVAGLGYLFAGLVDGALMLSLLVGSVPTVILGSLLRGRISGRWIQIALAVVLFVVGANTLRPSIDFLKSTGWRHKYTNSICAPGCISLNPEDFAQAPRAIAYWAGIAVRV
jgi:uncharacterized membrane protein YfcA